MLREHRPYGDWARRNRSRSRSALRHIRTERNLSVAVQTGAEWRPEHASRNRKRAIFPASAGALHHVNGTISSRDRLARNVSTAVVMNLFERIAVAENISEPLSSHLCRRAATSGSRTFANEIEPSASPDRDPSTRQIRQESCPGTCFGTRLKTRTIQSKENSSQRQPGLAGTFHIQGAQSRIPHSHMTIRSLNGGSSPVPDIGLPMP